jgi:hypothetical protein
MQGDGRGSSDHDEVPPVDLVRPLDADDPRFAGAALQPRTSKPRRRLVPSAGPAGARPSSPQERVLRYALPLVFFAGLVTVAAVFFNGLRPGAQASVVGPEAAVRVAVAERPKRVCFHDNNPCAWITLVDGELRAFNTNGPLPQEYGRSGVSWCPSSGYFGANATGSRYDAHGRLVRGPAPRGLDRFELQIDDQGNVVVDWERLTTGSLGSDEAARPRGPDCDTIPFDRDADLELG